MNLMDNLGINEYSDSLGIEIAILQQAIELPEITDNEEFPLTLETLEAFKEEEKTYKLAEHEYKDVIGLFYIPILFPLIENGESVELEFEAPSVSNILNDSLATEPYIERNHISLIIPKYIVMNFKKEIPVGTKFLIGFIGGSNSISNISIIGIYGHEGGLMINEE